VSTLLLRRQQVVFMKKHDEHDVKALTCEVDFKGTNRLGQVCWGNLTLERWCIPVLSVVWPWNQKIFQH